MRTALTTLERLRMVLGYREVAPGVLRLTIGDGWNVPAAEYHLSQLYSGYAGINEPGRPVAIELWKDNAKIGEYTADGLLIGPEFATPR